MLRNAKFRSFKTNIGVCFDFNERSSDELVIKMTIYLLLFFCLDFGVMLVLVVFLLTRDCAGYTRCLHSEINEYTTQANIQNALLAASFLEFSPFVHKIEGSPPPSLYCFLRSVCVQGIFCFSCSIRPFDKRGEQISVWLLVNHKFLSIVIVKMQPEIKYLKAQKTEKNT